MAIMTRLIRMCKADFHGVMDQLEDRELLLKQHLREMEAALDRKEARLGALTSARDATRTDHEACENEIENLTREIDGAIRKDRDDIARFLIRKLKPITAIRDEAGRAIASHDREIDRLAGLLEKQKQEYRQLQVRAREFFRAEKQRADQTAPAGFPLTDRHSPPPEEEVEFELFRRKEKLQKEALS